jgi:hypothetical protein
MSAPAPDGGLGWQIIMKSDVGLRPDPSHDGESEVNLGEQPDGQN